MTSLLCRCAKVNRRYALLFNVEPTVWGSLTQALGTCERTNRNWGVAVARTCGSEPRRTTGRTRRRCSPAKRSNSKIEQQK